jgi:glycosyltransferase involved in cell wall biosynthesis
MSMRVLVVNDGAGSVGGVQTYLAAVVPALAARGHRVTTAHDRAEAVRALSASRPEICFSHNMHDLDVERVLLDAAPVVKFMHGYFGTCVSGLKMHAFPSAVPCARTLGIGCLAFYGPRRCGQLGVRVVWDQWQWASRQRGLIDAYSAIVVASEHMRREFIGHGADEKAVHVNRLFPTVPGRAARIDVPPERHVVFLGRMTALKGGDVLIRAVEHARSRTGAPITLTMLGDGPQRGEWEALASALGVACRFPGWLDGEPRDAVLRSATIAAVPSVWPEPFGLAGLDAGAFGVPAIAFDVGGITEWLAHDVNGILVAPPVSPARFGDALANVLADAARLQRLRDGALRAARELTLERHVDRLEAIFARAHETRCASC